MQELGIIPVIGLDFQSGDLQDTVDIVEYGPLHNLICRAPVSAR